MTMPSRLIWCGCPLPWRRARRRVSWQQQFLRRQHWALVETRLSTLSYRLIDYGLQGRRDLKFLLLPHQTRLLSGDGTGDGNALCRSSEIHLATRTYGLC